MTCPDLESAIRATWRARPDLKGNSSGTARAVVDLLEWPATRLRSVRRAVAKLATLATEAGPRMKEEVDSMVDTSKSPEHGRGFGTPRLEVRRKAPALSPASLVGRDCEVRASGGSVTRGELVAVRDGWATLELHTGKTAVIRLDSVSAIVAENGLRAEGQADVEHRVGTSAADGDE